jgi:hypothetical protein
MKKVYITFAGRAYDKTVALLNESALTFGVDELRVYDDAWLMRTLFYQINHCIFDREPKFGFGWCCWKPYIILQEMKRLEYGDKVLYVDADTYPIADLAPLYKMDEPITLFESQGNPNRRFTQRDCFIAMAQDGIDYYDAIHACGRFQVFQKGDYIAEQFLMEWLTYSLNPLCQFSDKRNEHGKGPSRYGTELPEFYRNSAEQSVLTLLAAKYAIELHREACQFGWPAKPGHGQPGDTYPQLFHQQYCEGDRSDYSGSAYRNV